MTTRERTELLAYLFGGGGAEPALRCQAWMDTEPRFGVFLARHREKIRKKARSALGAEGLRDLLAELEIAHRLLRERRFDLAYEAYAAAKTRGPDFTVTYKTHIPFNVEVKRLRPGPSQPAARESRLMDALCDKLRQMPPSTANVLLIIAEHVPASVDLAAMLRRLVARVERADETLFARHGFASTRDFFARFHRLSAVLVRHTRGDAGASALWLNPQARHPLHHDLPGLLTHQSLVGI